MKGDTRSLDYRPTWSSENSFPRWSVFDIDDYSLPEICTDKCLEIPKTLNPKPLQDSGLLGLLRGLNWTHSVSL